MALIIAFLVLSVLRINMKFGISSVTWNVARRLKLLTGSYRVLIPYSGTDECRNALNNVMTKFLVFGLSKCKPISCCSFADKGLHCLTFYLHLLDAILQQYCIVKQKLFNFLGPGRVAQLVARLIQDRRFRVRYPIRPHTFVSPSADSRRAFVSYWQKYVHEVLVNSLEGLSLPRKSVVRLTDPPDMTM